MEPEFKWGCKRDGMNSQSKASRSEIWGLRFARFNDWVPAQKALLIFAIILPAQLAFKFFFDSMLGDLASFSWLFWFGLCVWVSCFGVFTVLAFRSSDSTIPYFFMVYGYGLWLIVVTYQTGWLDSSYSMYIAIGIMVFALIGSWQAVFHYLALWLCATVLIGAAQYQGWLEYGPMYSAPMDSVRPSLAWLMMNVTFIVQMVLITLVVLWLVINSRTQAIRALDRSNALVRRYLPPSVADQIIAGNEEAVGAPIRQRVTILFADIVGFTEIADRVEPEIMTEVLNDYMSEMAVAIEKHNGTLNEFAGDGLMALFGAPNAMTSVEQATSASYAALEMQATLQVLNTRWQKLGLGKDLGMRIGINTGMVSVGSYGSNGRMTYTAIGLQTNIASRIQAKASPGEILISDSTYQLLDKGLHAMSKGEIECRGVHFPVSVHTLKPSS